MNRFLSLLLALSMVLSLFSFSFAASDLSDIEDTDFEAAVDALVELGIVEGYPDGTYLPEKAVSRAEMAKLLVVAAGLEAAAEISEGATKFSDVNGGWESGYVNVASEYGYIVGYPDGSFKPNDTVSYSEAVTMALRVLGYSSVIESQGSWPTNYIAKAQDLKLLDDVSFPNYSDGASRGNMALLIWNMLRTNMWDVLAESTGDGLIYSDSDSMLNVKFPDYSYAKVEFTSFDIEKDGTINVTLTDTNKEKVLDEGNSGKYDYDGVDFYTFVPGTEVEVLVNEKDGTLLTMVPTGADKLVEGTPADITEDYDDFTSTADYVYARIKSREVDDSTELAVESEYITEVKESSTGIKLNSKTYRNKDYDDAVVIKDGERATLADVEEGDVLSKVTVDTNEFYVVSSTTVDGKFTKLVTSEKPAKATIGGTEYAVDANATYVEDPDDEDEKPGKLLASSTPLTDMRKEEVTAVLDFLGRVVRLEFDGNIGDEENSDQMLYIAMSDVDRNSRIYEVDLMAVDSEEEDTYQFATGANSIGKRFEGATYSLAGRLVLVSLNNDKEITSFDLIGPREKSTEGGDRSDDNVKPVADEPNWLVPTDDAVADDGDLSGDEYTFISVFNAKYESSSKTINGDKDDDETALDNPEAIRPSTTKIISIVRDEGKSASTDDDTFEVTIETGADVLKAIRNEEVLLIKEKDGAYVKYVVRLDHNKVSDDKLVGKLETVENKLYTNKDTDVEIDGENYYFSAKNSRHELDGLTNAAALNNYTNGVLVYTAEEAEDDEYPEITVLDGLTPDEIFDAISGVADAFAAKVEKIEDGLVKFVDTTNVDNFLFGEDASDDQEDIYGDALFILVDTDLTLTDEDKWVEEVTPYTYSDLSAKTFDDGDVLIVRSESGAENATTDDPAVYVYILRSDEGVSVAKAAGTSATVTGLGKSDLKASDFQDDIEIANGVISGTLNPVDKDKWEDNVWSDEILDNGYFILLDFGKDYVSGLADNDEYLFAGIKNPGLVDTSDGLMIIAVTEGDTGPIEVYKVHLEEAPSVGDTLDKVDGEPELIMTYTLNLDFAEPTAD